MQLSLRLREGGWRARRSLPQAWSHIAAVLLWVHCARDLGEHSCFPIGSEFTNKLKKFSSFCGSTLTYNPTHPENLGVADEVL